MQGVGRNLSERGVVCHSGHGARILFILDAIIGCGAGGGLSKRVPDVAFGPSCDGGGSHVEEINQILRLRAELSRCDPGMFGVMFIVALSP